MIRKRTLNLCSYIVLLSVLYTHWSQISNQQSLPCLTALCPVQIVREFHQTLMDQLACNNPTDMCSFHCFIGRRGSTFNCVLSTHPHRHAVLKTTLADPNKHTCTSNTQQQSPCVTKTHLGLLIKFQLIRQKGESKRRERERMIKQTQACITKEIFTLQNICSTSAFTYIILFSIQLSHIQF